MIRAVSGVPLHSRLLVVSDMAGDQRAKLTRDDDSVFLATATGARLNVVQPCDVDGK